MSRRLDISSLLCDEPPPKDPPRPEPQVVAETVLLAPHLRKPTVPNPRYDPPKSAQSQQARPTEHALDTLARAAALAEKHRDHRPESSFARTPSRESHLLLSPVDDRHRHRTVPQFAHMAPPSRLVLEQQQQQQHQHHLRLLQQQHQHQQQETVRLRDQHEQMVRQQAHWDHERGRVVDVMLDMRPGRKSDPGQLRPLTSPAPTHMSSHIAHMEPPNKRRRYSDSPGPLPPASNGFEWERTSSLTRPGDRSILNPEVEFGRPDLASRRPSSSSSHGSPPFGFPHRQRVIESSVLERHAVVGQLDGRIQSPPFPPPGRRSPPGSLSGRAKARKSDPDEPDVIPYAAERRDYTTVIHLPERGREEYVVQDDRKHKRSHSQSHPHVLSRPVEYNSPVAGPSRRPEQQQQQQQDTRPHGPPHRRPQPPPPTRQPKEEDAHEWLLEHFADPAPDPHPRRKAEPAMSPLPAPPLYKSQSPVHTNTKQAATSPLVPATMPEAAVALEQELASVHVPATSKEEPTEDGMDVDMAVSELVKETIETSKEALVGMEVDVEDELLSLVDGRPRSRSTTRAPSVSRALAGGSSKPPLRLQSGNEPGSRHGSPMASASSPSSFMSPGLRASSMLPPSERGSMPPPTSTATGQGKSKESASRKKKDTAAKPAPKPKAPAAAKPRARPAAKPKAKASDAAAGAGPAAKAKAPSAISRKSGSVAASASRSRSTSVMPGGSVGPDGSEKPEDEDEDAVVAAEDDKLYCVCKTKYDEDRFMIACDKCDEWYHTQCVDMPDLVVDLVDQFFCPLCIEKNPNLSLKTTYKPRCRYGLDHPEPDSPKACHKPAQGAFSKYCSHECGMNNMKKRIDTFAKNGGKKELLWDSVKDAQRREAVVIVHGEDLLADETTDGCMKENTDAVPLPVVTARVKPPSMGKVEREVASLNAVLDEIVTLREDLKEGMDIVLWRERLLELASERAEQVSQCGWDQRLCFGDDEWADFGAGVLESYEDGGKEGAMQVDGAPDPEEWWCVGSEKCERHAGWQAIRGHDIAKEKEKKEEALYRLTTREREIRKRIEDIVEPYNRSRCLDPGAAPLKSSKLVNGSDKGKTNGDSKKGKKRKNPS